MSNALGTLFTDIANAIREKTGDTATMKPAEFAENILGITGGGGGTAEGAFTVTFVNHDGTELFSRQVFSGDDCPDPIARGQMVTPTKESTVQYDFTYSGWSLTADGTASADVLKGITEDKTFYAVYTESVRYYTITYYDGDTVLKTESLAYGVMPSYVPKKDGYALEAWEPALSIVVSDASYSAVFVERIDFAHASWEKVLEIAASGKASQHFNIGDTRAIPLVWGSPSYGVYSDETHDVAFEILGFGQDVDENDHSVSMTIGTRHAINMARLVCTSPNFSNDFTNWATSELRNKLNDVSSTTSIITHSFPAEISASMKTVKKCYRASSTTNDYGYSSDKLFIPSFKEVTGQTVSGVYDSSEQYARYIDVNNRKKYAQDRGTVGESYVLYAQRYQFTKNVIPGIKEDGSFTFGRGNQDMYSCVLCFCI